MNLKTWIPLALAIVLGLIAAKVARDLIVRSRNNAEPGQARTVKIVVAKGRVSPGQELTADALTLGPIAAEAPPVGAFTDPGAVIGRVAVTEMFAGQPIMDGLLASKGAGAGLQALVPKGMRAITLEVNETSGVAGMILPGCRVDVVTTLNGASKEDTVACTVVQDVLVQAVGQRLSAMPNSDEKDLPPVKNVTLIATPREAEAIQLASSIGQTRLVLRGPDDRGINSSAGISFLELRREEGLSTNPVTPTIPVIPMNPVTLVTTPVATTQPSGTQSTSDPFAGESSRPRRTVTLIRGGQRSEVVFDGPAKSIESKSDQAVTSTNEGGAQQ